MDWDFAVLGTLRVSHLDRTVPVPANRQRALLATLLLNRGETVSVPALVDRIWGERVPENAKASLHSLVRRLRRTLTVGAGRDELIETRANGYVVTVPPERIDLGRFDALRAAASSSDDPGRRAELLRAALALWRGEPLADVDSEVLHRQDVPALTERWAQATEEYFDAELARGNHTEIIPELRRATRRSPLRERLWAQLMLALYRSDRQAEALDSYRALAATLAEELGLDPGPALVDLRTRILRADPALRWRPPSGGPAPVTAPASVAPASVPPAPVTPTAPMFQLPADPGELYGRGGTVDRMRQFVADAAATGRLPLLAVSGAPGVGKTALAIHVGHRMRDLFPDGQWYVRLRGQQPDPARPAEVLAEMLTYTGVRGAAVPGAPDARAAALRAALAGRRVLVVLDDAASAEQVEPLLPGTASCAVIVTSRNTLDGLVALHGGRAVNLDPLTPTDAVDLLLAIFREHRIDVARETVEELARLCGHVPLALRIAGANLATGSPADAADYVRRLRDGDRLDGLSVPGDPRVALRAAITPSYRRLGERERLALRLLAISPADCFTLADLTALLDVSPTEADAVLRTLTASHLVRPSHPDRFVIHDLIRLYAAELSDREDPADQRAAALTRLFTRYLVTADRLARRHHPRMAFLPWPEGLPPVAEVPDAPESPQWFCFEYANILAAIRHAARYGPPRFAWHLADRMRGYLQENGAHGEWRVSAEAGLAQARQEGDDEGIAAMESSLATLSASRADYADARRRYSTALAVQVRRGNRAGQAAILNNLGIVHREEGDLAGAGDCYADALRIYHDLGNRHAELSTLSNLGVVQLELDQVSAAIRSQQTALVGFQAISAGRPTNDVANVLHNLAVGLRALGRPSLAVVHLTRAVAIRRQLDNPYGMANDLDQLAGAYVDLGYHAKALRLVEECLAIARRIGRRRVEAEALTTLGTVELGMRGPAAAIARHQEALRLSQEIRYRRGEICAHTGLAVAYQAADRTVRSHRHCDLAAQLARDAQHHLLARQAREALGCVEEDGTLSEAC
ncbi:AfsR/SARP family transcriptional regulator [Micromonospora sagamiensis]|uniref:DNA-binding SARP family transcriptional activator n=1 Tax=Micromonospora sagamiensis TaxID=47875 RepID=A0A562WH51_9ACTN|nr:BTAD domain-containing putative transcriptional regulator [Micromonospora sagamiensis]TWJ29603.1 DNA-binding SARP family transcriptional activator [Micromonospora sagamiensis]BCL17368.1 SARP family transcriptional regulator [Micromonospora sagamiensis]